MIVDSSGSGGGYGTDAVEIIPLGPTGNTTVVGGVSLEGCYNATASGGQQVPTKKVDEGYTFGTRVGPDPIEATMNIWMNPPTYTALESLRDANEPISVYGPISLDSAAVTNLSRSLSGQRPGAYDVEVNIRQIQQGSTISSSVSAQPVTGPQSSSPDEDGGVPTRTLSSRRK
jgi:hypothetical protein